MPDPDEKTAALTSRTAVVASVLLILAVIVATYLLSISGDDTGATEASPAPETGYVAAGAVAPGFTLTSLDGREVSLSDYAGRPVLLNFWASWCPPCREEFPELAAARASHADGGLEILGLVRNDSDDAARQFAADTGAEWPMLPDVGAETWDDYGAVGLPTSYFIDAEGVVQAVHIGPLDEKQLADRLETIGVGDTSSSEDAV